VQGFRISRAVPAADVQGLLSTYNPAVSSTAAEEVLGRVA
jgi:hypothetical protein